MKEHGTSDRTPLYGPIPGRTAQGDAALFEDEAGTVVARVMITPIFGVPILFLADPEKDRPHEDPAGLKARHRLLETSDWDGYRGWDDPRFRDLCARFGIDPDKQRPTFEAWCRDVGEALLDCAMAAFEAQRFDEHGAAGKAAEALSRGATPTTNSVDDVLWRLDAIRDGGLRKRARAALEQLERSAEWQAGKRRAETAWMRDLVDSAAAAGTPVTIVKNADRPGGGIVFGDVGKMTRGTAPSLMRQVRGWFR